MINNRLNQGGIGPSWDPTPHADRAYGEDLITLFNRIGGIDGIISAMEKVQRLMHIWKQMGPMFESLQMPHPGPTRGIGKNNRSRHYSRGKRAFVQSKKTRRT